MADAKKSVLEEPGPARRMPSQKRSRERYERILEVATQLIVEKGSEALRMSDIVETAGVPFGSLYQYFPDKAAIIATLAERYNAIGHACVRMELEPVRTQADLHPALCRIVDSYYACFKEQPVMRDLWRATQGDKALQRLDEADMHILAGFLVETLRGIAPDELEADRQTKSLLLMHLIAAAVRFAASLPASDGAAAIALFKQMLPRDLAGALA